ncbi:F-box protein CPR1-like [Silene latifolia]|uniref:F-box protein CPR1-like n=1 Tax=Silene latifolia TaxID=37657 RepID=UPI003D77A31E
MDSRNSPPTICPYPISSKLYTPLLARCESYVLIGCGNNHRWPEALVLLNPITRIYRILPKLCIPDFDGYLKYGMCHCLDDEFNNDFKVVGFVTYFSPHENDLREVNIYSLRTNSWRAVECERTTGQWMDTTVLVQNHLLVMIFYDDDARMTRIGCFDIKAERWSNDVLLPDTISGEISSHSIVDGHYYYLGELDWKLRFSWYDKNKATYTVWVMKKYGDKSSWVKLMSLPVRGIDEVYHPIAYRKGSSHELLYISKYIDKYFWYNLRDKQFTQTGFDSDNHDTNLYFAFTCKGSLSTFPSF